MNSTLETICQICTRVRTATKQGASFQQLLTKIRKEFKDQNLGIALRTSRKKYLNHEEFYVNAYYDAEDDSEGDPPIEVIVFHNFNKDITWDSKQITDLLVQVFDAVVHEFKHQRQSRKRNYRHYYEHVDGNLHYQMYLADPDEVDAYALSIAIELCRTLGKFRALRYMSRFTSLAKIKMHSQYVSPNLNAYVCHFENLNHPILRTLATKVYIRLQKVDTDFIFM